MGISGGPFHGQYTPNLNGEERFLRGAKSEDVALYTQEDQVGSHQHAYKDSHLHYKLDSGCENFGAGTCDDCMNDAMCEYSKYTEPAGFIETRPKNIKVV